MGTRARSSKTQEERTQEERAMGSRKGNSKSGKSTGSTRRSATRGVAAERSPNAADRSPGEYAQEALSEWGQALRYAASALRPGDRFPLKERLKAKEQSGGRVGNAAYALCKRFADYPEFIDRIESVEEIDDVTIAFEAKVRGVTRRIEVNIVDERPGRRIDWEGDGSLEHSGVISFHELAPSLTHIELSVDLEPQDVVQRLTRAAHLTERAIRADMHQFKAYAELWQEEEAEEEDEPVDEEETAREQEGADEEELGDD